MTGATFLLWAWVQSLMCFSLRGLDGNVQDTGLGGRRGKMVFDGKDLEPRLESSAAAATGKLLNVILGQSGFPRAA